ncbi:NAD-dependent protein deacetylase sirtuin-3, mitochondrial [Felis catus]|uniref:NAD-dependent protein deacetylase sirtuin-3 n=2 Tax=Felis catus TaxID=9685 RepID=M3VYX5_FELCA|nr:NAD-dependent protein deacetylase sirtuin-3, mitochondrial [Felis catus]BAO00811.1 NAD-dependent protein deacetylase sirtuin-3 [Felis catus]
MARWVRPALCALRLWGPAGWRSLYTEVRDVPGKGHQGPSPGRTDAVAASLWGVRKASCAVGLAALNSGITGGRRPVSSSASASSIFGSGGNGKEKLFLQDLAELIRAGACRKAVVMVGAGVSTPSGIPDFRSPRSGLYSNLQRYDLPYPEAIFELTFFHHNPKPFFALAKELHPGSYRPNVIHYFLRLLHDKGLLLRLYTQNIDGLERAAGIPASKLVEAHGSFASATCTVCRRPFPGKDVWDEVMVDRIPRCPVCTGIVKPDIVFFGETLPQRFLLHVVDFPMADVLLILGTSLEVEPFASLSEAVRSSVPRLLINRDLVGPFAWRPRSRDVVQLGDMVHSVERLVELLGWTEELRDLMRQEAEKLNGRDR